MPAKIPSGLLIFGFGGHARVVADIALALGVKNFCFVDNNAQEGEAFLSFPVVTQWQDDLPTGWQAFSAAGDNNKRQQHCQYIQGQGWPLATLIAPNAVIGVGAKIATGCLIAHLAYVGAMATVGSGCIINTSAVVEHECSIGDFSHVSVHSTVAGRSKVGSFSMIGAGATVIDGIEIAQNTTVGAGSVVHRSLLEPGVYAGVPARKIKPL
jgi:sugar O-acyltransferase (sialic acid O-acetyltransferase NeuD family)